MEIKKEALEKLEEDDRIEKEGTFADQSPMAEVLKVEENISEEIKKMSMFALEALLEMRKLMAAMIDIQKEETEKVGWILHMQR